MAGYTRTDDLWLNISMGKMVNKKAELSYDGWTGKLVGIKRKTSEWEGNEVEKIEVRMVDESGKAARITFGAETYYALGFFSRIRKVNLNEPFLLGVWNDKKKNEKLSLCFIKQSEETVKAPEKDSPEALPQPAKVKVGNKTVVDWSECQKAFTEIIESIKPRLSPPPVAQSTHPSDAPEQESGQPSDDLPF